MSFDQLVADAQPALMAAEWEVTEGRSWSTVLELVLSDGTPVDLTGITGVGAALEDIDGATVAAFTVTIGGPDNNRITVTAAPDVTATAGGTGKHKRNCPMYLTLTNGAGRKADVWGVQESSLIISQGAA